MRGEGSGSDASTQISHAAHSGGHGKAEGWMGLEQFPERASAKDEKFGPARAVVWGEGSGTDGPDDVDKHFFGGRSE